MNASDDVMTKALKHSMFNALLTAYALISHLDANGEPKEVGTMTWLV